MEKWVPVPWDHKFKFGQGYSQYAPSFGKPIPDWYWDPNPGVWLNLPTSLNDVSDRNWPAVRVAQFETPDYDTIYRQWFALPRAEQDYAFWDPARKKWMRIARRVPPSKQPPNSTGPDIDWLRRQGDAIRAAKAAIFELRAQQFIGQDTESAINAALDKEAQRWRGGR